MDAALIPALHDALVVAQTGSVGEAARRLGKSTSAVSQQLRRIEAQLGVALFEKLGRGVRLSPAGEVALGSLTRLFDEAASLGGLLEELGGAGRVTTLRVAASDYLGEALLLPVLRQLSRLVSPSQQAFGKIESLVRVRQLAPELVHLEAEAVELLAKVGIGRRTARTVADAVRNGLTEGAAEDHGEPDHQEHHDRYDER